MNRELLFDGGRFKAIQQDDVTATDPHGNGVVYPVRPDGSLGPAVWDRRAQEVIDGTAPTPQPPSPVPPVGALSPIRVTFPSDGIILNRGYAYHSQICIIGALVYVFVQVSDNHPRFFEVHLETRTVRPLGPLLPYESTGEGWYFDRAGAVYLCDGASLRRADLFSGYHDIAIDIGKSHPGCRLWQAHSSDDGTVHSATVERIVSDGPYPRIGTVVESHGVQTFYASQGELDESQIDASGRFLLIKEQFIRDKKRLDNRIIDFVTGSDVWVRDEEGAVGHSDMGPGFVVGEDDQIGACVKLDLSTLTKTVLFSTWGMGSVSVRSGRCLRSSQTHLSLVGLDESGVTPLLEHEMIGGGYDFQVHGNLSPCGRVVCYVTNSGGGRMDAWIVVLPA